MLLREVEQLRACEVRVWWPRDGWLSDERGRFLQFLDDGVYGVELNPALPDVEQMQVLEQAWSLWLEPNNAAWFVESVKPDEPGSPMRITTLLR